MFAVFIKEMHQFRRGYAKWIVAALFAVSVLLGLFSYKTGVLLGDLIYPALFLALLIVSGESASTWRRELGDPAFSPGVNTAIPPLFIALGKVAALLSQLLVTAVVFSPVLALGRLSQFKVMQANGIWLSSNNVSGNFFKNLALICDEYAVAFLAFALLMTTVPLAVCSIKPRHKAGGRDFGSWASVVVMGIICLSEYNKMLMLNWKWQFLLDASLTSIGAVLLIAVRVAPAASDRMMPFKIFMILQALVIKPLLLRSIPELNDLFSWRETVFTLAGYFSVMALFERVEQSRRVLNIRRPLWVTVGVFPVTTGALNSITTALICFVTGCCIGEFSLTDIDMCFALTIIFAAVAALNISRAVRGAAIIWFIVIVTVVFLLLLTMGFSFTGDEGWEKFKISIKVGDFLFAGGIAAGVFMLSRLYGKKRQNFSAAGAEKTI